MFLQALRTYARWGGILLSIAVLSGCAIDRQRHNTSSAVDFLYPETKEPVNIEPSIPVLSLPLRVGIAFVPSHGNEALSEQGKEALLSEVAANFKSKPFIKSIEVIPSAYLRTRGSFSNLDQIKSMYGVDVIALVGYDQIQFTDENFLSLTYWTIVGAYIVPGEKNSTHTMLDTVVYDIASRKMLFRAPGTSEVKGRATPINQSEQLRLDSAEGLQTANKMMIANLDLQLTAFKAKVKEQPADYKIVHQPGYSGGGGGSLDWLFLLAMATGTLGVRFIKRRNAR